MTWADCGGNEPCEPFVSALWRELYPWACVAEPEVEYLQRCSPIGRALSKWLSEGFTPGQCWQASDAGLWHCAPQCCSGHWWTICYDCGRDGDRAGDEAVELC